MQGSVTALIYNRPGHHTHAQAECKKSTIENSDNVITREIPLVTQYDRDSYTPYPSVCISRKKVKREMRRIRRKARKVSGFAVIISSLFSVCVATGVLYLSYNGIYAPEGICRAAVDLFELICCENDDGNISNESMAHSSNNATNTSAPVYLSATSPDAFTDNPQKTIAASGEEGSALRSEKAPENAFSGDVVSVSEQGSGKSGSDGKVYLPLVHSDLSNNNLLVLSNQTKLSPDTTLLSQSTAKVYENLSVTGEPLVLILHTHATECYTEGENGIYEKDEPTRSDDTTKNVVAVGETLATTLQDFGIPVVHSQTLHDKASFLNAYTSSLNEAHAFLTEYPSIKFVIDLHRDAIISNDGEKTAPAVQIAGENYAQLMFVIGTNETGFNHPNWRDNLSFALDMQKSINEMYPGLMRPINLRSVSFNEQLASGYVLLEAGACGNTLEEAKRSAQAFGTVLAKRILEESKGT